jgi:protein gp37
VRTRFLSVEPLLEDVGRLDLDGIHWAIVGGESGPGARPMQERRVLSIKDQCRRARVPFFFKQWGGVVKSRAGRVLQGRVWDEMPARLSEPPPPRPRQLELLAASLGLSENPLWADSGRRRLLVAR